jgi:hypothetical protein
VGIIKGDVVADKVFEVDVSVVLKMLMPFFGYNVNG